MLLYATLTVQKENQIFAVSLRPVPLLCHNVHNSQSGSQRQLKADRIALHSFEKSSFSDHTSTFVQSTLSGRGHETSRWKGKGLTLV